MSGLQPGPSLGDGLLEPTINTQRPAGILAQVNEYKIISELGKGAFGLVYVVERDIVDNPASTTRGLENNLENKTKNENRFAMKVLTETPHQKTFRRGPGSAGDSKDKKLMREIAILKKLNHPHLVKLYAAIRESVPPYSIFIILEYIEAGPIMKAINCENGGSPRFVNPILKSFLGESLASRCFRGVLSALSYLHRNKIAHRDLKPDNILVDFDWCVKVTDFGVSEQFTTPSTRGMCKDTAGTWPFWSPEMCSDDDEGDGSYGAYKADVWAAGVCLWCFVYGALPFWGDTPTMLFESISHENPVKPCRRSPQLEEVLDAMLQKDPDLRPSPEECEKLTWLQQHSTAETELALTAYNDSVDNLLHEVDEHELANAFTPGSLRFSESIDKKLRKWKRRASHSVHQRKSDVIRDHSRRLSSSYQTLQDEIARATSRSCSRNNSSRASRSSLSEIDQMMQAQQVMASRNSCSSLGGGGGLNEQQLDSRRSSYIRSSAQQHQDIDMLNGLVPGQEGVRRSAGTGGGGGDRSEHREQSRNAGNYYVSGNSKTVVHPQQSQSGASRDDRDRDAGKNNSSAFTQANRCCSIS